MKRRTFIFTEQQLKKILGEDFTTYLDKSDSGCDYNNSSIESNNSEVKPTEDGGKTPPTTDKVASEKIPTYPWNVRSFNTIYESKKKRINNEGETIPETCPKCGGKINLYLKGEPVWICSNKDCGEYYGTFSVSDKLTERNHQLDGKTFRLGRNTNQMVDDIARENKGDKMINNMSSNKDTNISTLYTRLYRIRKMKDENPQRYNNIGGKQLEKTISSTIERAKQIGQSLSNTSAEKLEYNTNSKITNQKGHRKQGNTITYYENV